MITIPPARLAEMPPSRWGLAKSRLEVVNRFLAQGDRSTAMVRRFAKELNVSKGLFYNMLAARERWAEQDDEVLLPAPRRKSDPAVVSMIEEAIALCGPSASLDLVHVSAQNIARQRGLSEANLTLVRRVHGRNGAGNAIGARLGTGEYAILDAAALGVRVYDGRMVPVLPMLNALVNAQGVVVDWTITTGRARHHELEPLIDTTRTRSCAAGIVISNAFDGATRMRLASPDVDETGISPVRKGSALLAAVGLKVGRIPILPNTPIDTANEDVPLVDHDDLKAVLEILLPRLNA